MEKALAARAGKREARQAEILRVSRERTRCVYERWRENKITEKELGKRIRDGEADFNLVREWKRGHKICCMLCIRKGRRCICRRVEGIECANCKCTGCSGQ